MKCKIKDLEVKDFWKYADKTLAELSHNDLETLENLLRKERLKRTKK